MHLINGLDLWCLTDVTVQRLNDKQPTINKTDSIFFKIVYSAEALESGYLFFLNLSSYTN
jgi:hypothetical protein